MKTFFNNEQPLYTHSCIGSILSLPSYLENGIISHTHAEEGGINIYQTYDRPNNADRYICVSKVPSSINALDDRSSFKLYAENFLSFVVIPDSLHSPCGNTCFSDEYYAKYYIGIPEFVGIMIPDIHLDSSLSNFSIGLTGIDKKPKNILGFFENITNESEKQFNYVGDTTQIRSLIAQINPYIYNSNPFNYSELLKQLESELCLYTENAFKNKLSKDSVTVFDALNYYYNQYKGLFESNDLRIYNTKMEEMPLFKSVVLF